MRDTSLPTPGSDRIMRLDAPFTGKPVEVARTEFPLDGMMFTWDGARLLTFESYEPRRLERQAWLDAKSPAKRGVLVFRSSEGVYDDPGEIATRSGHHDERAWVTADGKGFFRFGAGFRADGQRPFLDRCAFEGAAPRRDCSKAKNRASKHRSRCCPPMASAS